MGDGENVGVVDEDKQIIVSAVSENDWKLECERVAKVQSWSKCIRSCNRWYISVNIVINIELSLSSFFLRAIISYDTSAKAF